MQLHRISLGRLRQLLEFVKTAFNMRNRFKISRTHDSLLSSFAQERCCPQGSSCF